ncbi:hypothetical protein WJX81_008231 [Elliptochloris bilobata]|uniref:F-box domain-containing protein n=1 Tax=Elliptochloris bilobata TaxID=381761 RepID=A0AAW1QV91_9CHLO
MRQKRPGDESLLQGRFLDLPAACLYQVFILLDPVSLATSACVCREWQATIAAPEALPLWGSFLRAIYPQVPAQTPNAAPAFAKNDRELFYASAKVTLSTLACYKHNRVTFIKPFGGSDLGW